MTARIWRDEKKLTDTLVVPRGFTHYRLPRKNELKSVVARTPDFLDTMIDTCVVKHETYPLQFHGCDQHAVFLKWNF